MNQALFDLHAQELITLEMALARAPEPNELQTMIAQGARNMRSSAYRGAG